MTFSKPLSRYRVSFPHTFNNVELVGAFLFPYPHTHLKLLSRAWPVWHSGLLVAGGRVTAAGAQPRWDRSFGDHRG